MNALKQFISFLVYSNIWISIGSACFGWFYFLLTDEPENIPLILFLFFATLLTYTYQRFEKIIKKDKFHGPRMNWMEKNFLLVKVLMMIGGLGTVCFSLYLSVPSLILLSIGGLISFLYAFKFNLTNRPTNLRDIPGIKIYLIGIVWGLSCAVIPWMESDLKSEHIVLLTTGFVLYIIGITIPFDIRDIKLDELDKKTIPQIIGVNYSKLIALFLMGVTFFFLSYPNFQNLYLLVSLIPSAGLILLAKESRNELFFSFFTDGLLIQLPITYYLLQSL